MNDDCQVAYTLMQYALHDAVVYTSVTDTVVHWSVIEGQFTTIGRA